MFATRWHMQLRAGVASLAALVALVAVPAVPASASSALNPRALQSRVVYLSPDRNFAVLVPLAGVSKQSYSASNDLLALGVPLGPQSLTSSANASQLTASATRFGRTIAIVQPQFFTQTTTLSGSNSIWTCPPGGSCSNTGAWFSTTVTADSGWWSGTMSFSPGNSQAAWWGCCPWNATTMYLSDSWSVSGLSVSVTISMPPGLGLSGSGSNASWSSSVNNVWLIDHGFNGIQFSGIVVCCPSESATATSQFGGYFRSTTANS